MFTRIKKSIALLTLLINCGFAYADNDEQVASFNNYDIHYSVFNTSFLAPEVASAYGITRSKELALVNIAVRKHKDEGESVAVPAIIHGNVRDLIHKSPLEFKEVREQNAVYYLSTVKIDHKQTVYFTISVQPDPNIKPYTFEFPKTLYVD